MNELTETPRVYIVLVNWNGWQDTIQCLESVFRLSYPNFCVIVCDNASTDDSIERIAEWASGDLAAGCSNPELGHLTSPACRKPLAFVELEPDGRISLSGRSEKLILVKSSANRGFAGGNNVGLRVSLSAGDFEYAWLLNNDTIVDPGALTALVERMHMRPDAGICGSTLLYYHNPKLIQALGGSVYHPWIARSGHLGARKLWNGPSSPAPIERRMRYVCGASMLVSRSFLEDIGLMNETYFLYSEEIDWARRARGKYALAYAPRSIVYHREGSSIGTASSRKQRSVKSDYYSSLGRMLITRRYFPIFLPIVATALVGGGLFRYLTGNKPGARAVWRALREALRSR